MQGHIAQTQGLGKPGCIKQFGVSSGGFYKALSKRRMNVERCTKAAVKAQHRKNANRDLAASKKD